MLRKNPTLLAYTAQLYQSGSHAASMGMRQFEPGQQLLTQGDELARIYIIEQGITKCYVSEENGKSYLFEFLGAGEITGEIEVLKSKPCLCTIEAVTPVNAYTLSLPLTRHLLETDTTFMRLLLGEMADRMVNTSTRASFQQLYSIEHALGKLLHLQAGQGISLSKNDMASYLGITLRSLNRLLKQLGV